MQCNECKRTVSEKAIYCPSCGCPIAPGSVVVRGRGEDVNYYRTVRATIQRLDQLRLQAVAVGLTFVAGLLGASAAAVFSWDAHDQQVLGLPLAYLTATTAAALAALLAQPFLTKIDMFNKFLSEAVAVAGDIEVRILRECDFPHLALTRRFEAAHASVGCVFLRSAGRRAAGGATRASVRSRSAAEPRWG